ncbi:Protein of unknown function, DUF488 [Tessaracoccus bendigoensis DSM 12906]|uniref:DUF488 domain-containing protein n=1 Tax=Tessaracoccus bendigoensis DSM 12906 TaxID=1123357 RepID=A0A1M6CAJ3_9ACTN|nr:DUF488 domain-containing protein [Tessaracoccus bendigoensis]SHI57821.1 Protein of unknown function, DUF488 [Tessaracoccus bendigoensis DSM 12906]
MRPSSVPLTDIPSDTALATVHDVFTVGHSTRDFDELIGMLRQNQVSTLVDVRSYPSSRAYPQWNQDAIINSLPDDLDYVWIRDLGGRRHTPAGVPSVNGGWRVKAFRDYADYMATPGFQAGLHKLLRVAEHGSPAIMCSEAVPWRCHRRLITDALLARRVPVFDIMSETLTRPAKTTPFARVEGQVITYPARSCG